jgi:competence protein ComEA
MDFNRTERRALLLGTGLLLLGAAVRLGLGPAPVAVEWVAADSADSRARDLAGTRREVAAGLEAEEHAARPLAPGERIDPNTAPVAELRRLSGIGPSRAAAIVAEREAGGPFRDLEDLTRVAGIGPTTAVALAPRLTLGSGSGSTPRARASPTSRTPRIDVNRAQIKELEQITGIGPVLAARIVDTRRRLGRFRGPEDLLRVPGIGPAILQRMEGEVRF